MKNGKYIAILIIGIVVIIGVAFAIRLLSNFKTSTEILKNEYTQREMLAGIYTDMIDSPDINFTLDESALTNIITNEPFSTDTINYLKTLENHNSTDSVDHVLSISYFKETGVLTVTLKSKYSVETQKYSISVENGEVKYEADGLGTLTTSHPAVEE